ncbi:NYN domain-containing protein [Persicirhabdus sediminis]|uniref:NYN domain-containing protein n=1 Tax=Persicirhabdus sediminis TaxID=454144 RepID=A0A8J7MKG2_9BACT|nr:NYN domain-containing protein [Persicirhabdus sediminis]MBK1792673.1 NYN domain-containing protein [Persicirhabdus sediminis]
MQRVIIVDGHSVIFASDELRTLHDRDQPAARQQLIDDLNHYQDITGANVVLVYDGKQTKRGQAGGTNSEILVLYSKNGQTADSVIERIVAQKAAKFDITVASNDRMELDTVAAFGGHCMSARSLLEDIDRQLGNFRREWGI